MGKWHGLAAALVSSLRLCFILLFFAFLATRCHRVLYIFLCGSFAFSVPTRTQHNTQTHYGLCYMSICTSYFLLQIFDFACDSRPLSCTCCGAFAVYAYYYACMEVRRGHNLANDLFCIHTNTSLVWRAAAITTTSKWIDNVFRGESRSATEHWWNLLLSLVVSVLVMHSTSPQCNDAHGLEIYYRWKMTWKNVGKLMALNGDSWNWCWIVWTWLV